MKKRLLKLALVLAVPIVVLGSSTTIQAFPPMLAKAEKFGAKDCTFCHVTPAGGAKWNARGRWLIAEKKRLKADAVDVDWLAKYKAKKGK
jgi:hypothetical protein